MSAELVPYDDFEFQGDRLPLLVGESGKWVSFIRLCNIFGLDPVAEWKTVRADDSFDGQTRIEYAKDGAPFWYINAEAVPGWLFAVRTERLRADLRAKHVEYKRGLLRAIYDFTTKGVAIKDGTPLVAILKVVGEYAIGLNPCEKTRMIVSSAIESELARLAGRSSDSELPITVGFRVQDRRIKMTGPNVKRTGTVMAAVYRDLYKREPETFPQIIEGALRAVKSYRPIHLAILDDVIDRCAAVFATEQKGKPRSLDSVTAACVKKFANVA